MTDEEKSVIERLKTHLTQLENRICSLKRKNASLENKIEKMKRCSNCKHFNKDYELCFFSGGDEDYCCRNRRWELAE